MNRYTYIKLQDQSQSAHADMEFAIARRAAILADINGDKANIAYVNADKEVRAARRRLASLSRKLGY